MPRLREEHIDNNSLLGLWEISESAEELERMIRLNHTEQLMLDSFRNDTRRKHWLSYRLLIRELLGTHDVEVSYTESGKPFITQPQGHISVSHSGIYSAVIFSKTRRVGIDVEKIQDRIERVRHKFLSPAEMEMLQADTRIPQLVTLWAAKESLYKLCGELEVEFNEHLRVEPFEYLGKGILSASVLLKNTQADFKLQYECIGEYILVWVTD
jgi:phosphopantetheinyl transferase